jgi:hypothetical protein
VEGFKYQSSIILPSVFPNPAGVAEVTYKFPVYSVSDVVIRIFDTDGKYSSVFAGSLSVGMYEMLVDIRDFSLGVYFIHIETADYKHSYKLVIDR